MSFVKGFPNFNLSFWPRWYLTQSREKGVPIEMHITQALFTVHFWDSALGFHFSMSKMKAY